MSTPGCERREGACRSLVASALLVLMMAAPVSADGLPEGLVYLRDVDASIAQEIRYAGTHNFLGRPAAGYQAAECILTVAAAKALQRVQRRIAPLAQSLKVYDCYRPVAAVRDFLAWSRDASDTRTKAEFYPTVDKRRLFALGYIAEASSHSQGNAVDLTIVPSGSISASYKDGDPLAACHLPAGQRFADNSLDFGTGYDCFHPMSHLHSRKPGDAARRNRARLVRLLRAEGFTHYTREWWHFVHSAGGERRSHDVPIEPWRPRPR